MTNVQFTPNGNCYEKTSTGKKVGLATGAVAGGIAFRSILKKALKDDTFVREFAEKVITKKGPYLNPEATVNIINKTLKGLPRFGLLFGATVVGGIGLLTGAIIDKFRNNARKHAADNVNA